MEETSKNNQTAQLGIGGVSTSTVDLSKCKKGDILISSHGAKLEYIAPTPWKHYTYLDHMVGRHIATNDTQIYLGFLF